jgi:hypothetical protein
MKNIKTITILVSLIAVLAFIAISYGITSNDGPGPYHIESVRGETVTVYGKGLYKHMSIDVAPQGIAQDYVTLFIGIPLLLLALFRFREGSVRGHFLLAGVLGYFLVTYLFYLVMGMYNMMFLVYVILLSSSFFAFSLTTISFNVDTLPSRFNQHTPVKITGGFLIFNSVAITFMWLGIVVPPLADGSIIPKEVEHYTTLIVQGLDLALLLPLSFVSGLLFIRREPFGYLLAPVYFVFLSIMMTALTAKVIAMATLGQNVMPAIIIIPAFNLLSIICTVYIFKNIREPDYE